ncbi:MAG: DUF3108 domain-containing protein [Ignavibacteria bacterium]|nr:DUF3108 domain-containing protein [Ignavibacteria bacterium]
MKKHVLISIVLLLALSTASVYCQNQFRYVKNDAFGYGERLEYKVGVLSGPLSGVGGSGGLYINKNARTITLPNGEKRECYEVNFWVDSEGLVETLHPIHDKYRTIIDVGGIFPYEFQQMLREGSFKRDFKASFDQINHFANVGDKKYEVMEYVQDILSNMYLARTMDLSDKKIGDVIILSNFYKDTTYTLPVKIVKREVIKVPAGKFKTIVVQPGVAAGGLFKFTNNITIWITDDERKIPVKVATSVVIGNAGAELVRYSGIRGKIDAKIE